MFVSFLLPSIFEGVQARHLLVFYKQLADYGSDQVAFVGEPGYFRPPGELKAEGRPEWQASWREAYDYEPPDSLNGVECTSLPVDLLAPRLSRLGSSWKLYGRVVTRRLPELETALASALDDLRARHQVEAAIAFANLPSLTHVANLRGLPVIHTEFGPLRKPTYAMTGYWDLKGVTRRTDAARRYRRFRRELSRSRLPLLDSDELLSTLRRVPLPPMVSPSEAPFRVGLALQGEENAHVHGVSALDCLSVARQHVHQRDILVRYHSGGLARYSDTLGTADTSSNATEFILKSERIITVNSGVALEALLLGRRCVVLGDSPFSIACDRSFDSATKRDRAEQRAALNFLTLGYLVPCALMFNADYARWRLSNPPETEIFRHHQNWYRTALASSSTSDTPAIPAADTVVVRTPEPGPTVIDPASVSTSLERAPGTSTILVVYPYCLDQVGHGNIQRVLSMARYIAASRFAVDLVYQGNPQVAPVAEQYSAFRRVYRVEGGAFSTDDEAVAHRLAAFYSAHEPPAAHLRPSAPLTTLVRALLDAEPYQAVVATYAWMAPIFAGLARGVPRVCDVQDILHEHAEACHRTTGHTSSFSLSPATEAFLWRQWDALVAITPEDTARIRQELLPQQRVLSARHAAPGIAPTALAGDDDVALYAASDNMSNVQALHWLLDRVWPLVIAERPGARLQIAGLICRALPASAHDQPGVEVLGFRSDLREDIARAGVIVAPYLYGSGLKIKVVEAAGAGKAIVTTPAGVAGSGLRGHDAVAVESQPREFASALSRLLGNHDLRCRVAAAALEQARVLYSVDACYGPVVDTLQRLASASVNRAPSAGFSASALRRITTVVEHLQPRRVVLWGNGAHTRTMVAALETAGISVSLIVDGLAETISTSPEGISVRPGGGFGVTSGDLVILSSETFEPDMWRALSAYRAAGGWVLGLWDERRISRAVLDRLSARVRAQLGVPPLEVRASDALPSVVLWDSSATPARWWRTASLQGLAQAAHARGIPVVVSGPSSILEHRVDSGWPDATTLMPILELDGRSVEARDSGPDNASNELARLVALTTKAITRATVRLPLSPNDLLVLMSPSLSECLAIARVLSSSESRGPSIVVHDLSPTVDGPHWSNLPASDLLAYWKLAIGALAEASAGRLQLTTRRNDAAALEQFLDRPVCGIDRPSPRLETHATPVPPQAVARIVCFGHVCANVRPLLEALVGNETAAPAFGPVSVAWRSSGHGSGPVIADRWAVGLASLLGVELLDGRTPSEVLAAIAGADVIVLSDGPHDRWAEDVCAHASAAGVPVVATMHGAGARALAAGTTDGATYTPGDARSLVSALGRIVPRRMQAARAPEGERPLSGVTDSLLDQLLAVSGYGQPFRSQETGSLQPSDPSLMTEIAHATAY